MATVKYYELGSVQDEVLDPSVDWMKDVFVAISCPKCFHLLPPFRREAVDVDVVEEPVGPIAGIRKICIECVRSDLFHALDMESRGFLAGKVGVGGRTLTNYVSLLALQHVRVSKQGNDRSEYSSCKTCGRAFEMTPGIEWIRLEDAKGQAVLTTISGTGIMVKEELIAGLSESLRLELKLWPILARS